MLNINIIILKNGFVGYNIYNIYGPNENNNLNNNYIFLNFINDNHFDYLILNENNPNYDNKENYLNYIIKYTNKNKIELEKLHKKIYPLSLRFSPNIYNESSITGIVIVLLFLIIEFTILLTYFNI